MLLTYLPSSNKPSEGKRWCFVVGKYKTDDCQYPKGYTYNSDKETISKTK